MQKCAKRELDFQYPRQTELKQIRGIVYYLLLISKKDSPIFIDWFVIELIGDIMKTLFDQEGFSQGFRFCKWV